MPQAKLLDRQRERLENQFNIRSKNMKVANLQDEFTKLNNFEKILSIRNYEKKLYNQEDTPEHSVIDNLKMMSADKNV